MRHLICLASALLICGCSEVNHSDKKVAEDPQHPQVVVQGVDGTTVSGELLNGSVTVDSGQGEMVLLTDHLHSISMAQDVDKLDSDSVKVSGKIKDTRFLVRNEHGVFTLSKDRLRTIDFVLNPAPTIAQSGGATVVHTTSAAAK